ncbi:hypothetical protein E2C01_083402 [Portunus trituberculatus]|uniref:Uncharacterized protein n=1 Tax=Portunus trituberculatus TaxID=210409 RepID=A0A5B7J3E1_PORTR|nr:hypothetical protein [Portunus trituberculatus]
MPRLSAPTSFAPPRRAGRASGSSPCRTCAHGEESTPSAAHGPGQAADASVCGCGRASVRGGAGRRGVARGDSGAARGVL